MKNLLSCVLLPLKADVVFLKHSGQREASIICSRDMTRFPESKRGMEMELISDIVMCQLWKADVAFEGYLQHEPPPQVVQI